MKAIFILYISIFSNIQLTNYIDIITLIKFEPIIILTSETQIFKSPTSSVIIESKTKCSFKYSGYLFNNSGLRKIQIIGSNKQILQYKIKTFDIGNNRQQFFFNKKSENLINLILNSDFIDITVFDNLGVKHSTRIITKGFKKFFDNF